MLDLSHIILDGANGTELQKRGMPPGCCSEQWILEHPQAETEIQQAYVLSGSTAVLAPTFCANRAALGRYGLGDKVREYNLQLVALSRNAVGKKALVGGDISPTGLCCGAVEPALLESVADIFREQVQALEEAGVDFYMVETQISLAEARIAVETVKALSLKPVFASFTMAGGGKSFSGGDIACALLTLEKAGVAAFGINCVDNPQMIADTLKRLRPLTHLPLLVQANAGLPEMIDGKSVYSLAPEKMAEDALSYYQAGADIFGACCGSGAEHIKAIAKAVSKLPFRTHPPRQGAYACSEYMLTALDAKPKTIELTVDAHWEETLDEIFSQDWELCRISLDTEEQLTRLLHHQDMLRIPLSLSFANKNLQARFERFYAGVAHIQ